MLISEIKKSGIQRIKKGIKKLCTLTTVVLWHTVYWLICNRMAEPVNTLELLYPMIQFLMKTIINLFPKSHIVLFFCYFSAQKKR